MKTHKPVVAPVTAAARRVAGELSERLESRRLLAAPEIAPLTGEFADLDAPVGQAYYIPVTATDADGDAITFSASLVGPNASDAQVEVVDSRNTFLAMQTRDFGTMVFQLFDDVAPETVDRISGLADAGYYDGLNIFRIIDGFVLQFGDPTENGQNPSPLRPRVDFSFDDEFDTDALFTGDGQLAMANSGKDTNSSQFFLTDGTPVALNGNHTVFGQLVRGFGTRDTIMDVPTGFNDRPVNPVVVTQVRTVDIDDAAVVRLVVDDGVAADTEFTLRVEATDGTESSSREFAVEAELAADAPAILQPFDATLVTDVNQPIVVNVPAIDPDGEAVDLEASFVDFSASGSPLLTSGEGSLVVDDANGTVTFTPATGFTGAAEFFVYARTDGATSRGTTAFAFDRELVRVGVGDEGAAGTSRTFAALAGAPLQDVVVATFTDLDAAGTAADWTATIDWGDGNVDGPASANPVVVRSGATPGQFEVVGSHTYANAALGLPVFVTVDGDLGAQLRIQSEADVLPVGSISDTGTLSVNGTSAADTITLDFDGTNIVVEVNGEQSLFDPTNIDLIELFGRDGNDTITMADDAPRVRIFAGAGDDTVRGGLNDDEIFGQAGNDSIDGFGGNDSLSGGDGDDYVMGGTGINYDAATLDAGFFDRDTIDGGAGNDTLSGGLDANLVQGGEGDDLLNGSGGRDTLEGGDGNDRLRGFGNADLLVGGDNDDTLVGDAFDGPRGGPALGGDDILEGGNGDDLLQGFFADDLFRGGTGADALFGGDGIDEDEESDPADTRDSIEIVP
jgi:cyclophilin family peptidyl-prolyl cis-trans isomerase